MLKSQSNKYTKEQELELGREVQRGLLAEKELTSNKDKSKIDELKKARDIGRQAQEKLFIAEIGLANMLSSRLYKNAGIRYSLDDIAQDAYVGLTEATKTYDPSKNCRFSTHAYYLISKKISVSLNRMRSIRLPENKMGQHLAIIRAEKKYLSNCTNEDFNENDLEKFILKDTGLSKEVYLSIKQSLQPLTSTSAPISETSSFGDLLEDKNANSRITLENTELIHLLSKLSDSEQNILCLNYDIGGIGINYNDYLKSHNLTKEEMDKKVKSIIRKLRRIINRENRENKEEAS